MKSSYVGKLAFVFGITWGLGGLDRVMVGLAAPAYLPALGLNLSHLGLIAAANGAGVALGAWIIGPLSEYYGRKLGTIWGNLGEHLFSGLSAIVGGFLSMVGARALMGACVGALYGPSYAAISEESPPEKRGHYVGLAQSFWPLIGMGIGPIVAGYLMTTVGWRWSFALIAIPGILCVIYLASFMREPASVAANIKRRQETGKRTLMHEGKEVHLWDVLKYRNILLSTLISISSMGYLFVLFTFVPVFFGKVHGLNPVQTGWVMCGGGFIVFIGQNVMPRISDHIGRKPALLLLFALGALGGILFAIAPPGTSMPLLALYFALFCAGLASYPLFLALVPIESVPFTIAATAVAVPQGVGEVLGATLLPALAGFIAQTHGLTGAMWMVVCALGFSFVCSLFLVETAPKIVAKKAAFRPGVA